MENANEETCSSCVVIRAFIDQLDTIDKELFSALADPVTGVIAAIATFILVFRGTFISMLDLDKTIDAEYMVKITSMMGRLAFAGIFLSSFPLWKEWVIDSLVLIMAGISSAAFSKVAELQGSNMTGDGFEDLARIVENAIYKPVQNMQAIYERVQFGPLAVMDKMGITLAIWSLKWVSMFLVIVHVLTNLIWIISVKIITGIGPVVIALAVFDQTRHFAISILRIIIASGAIVTIVSLVTAVAVQMASSGVDWGPAGMPDQIEVDELDNYVFSAEYGTILFTYLLTLVLQVVFGLLTGFMILRSYSQGIK